MKLAKDSRGSAGLDFAIVAPIWTTFAIGIMQTAMLLWVDNMMHDVVDATARCMAVNVNNPAATKCHDLATMRTYAMSISSTNSTAFWQASDFHLNDPNAGTCTGGSQVSIVYSYTFLFVHPLTISAKSCYPNWS
jgi:Flp pilus assembly protein TadG